MKKKLTLYRGTDEDLKQLRRLFPAGQDYQIVDARRWIAVVVGVLVGVSVGLVITLGCRYGIW